MNDRALKYVVFSALVQVVMLPVLCLTFGSIHLGDMLAIQLGCTVAFFMERSNA